MSEGTRRIMSVTNTRTGAKTYHIERRPDEGEGVAAANQPDVPSLDPNVARRLTETGAHGMHTALYAGEAATALSMEVQSLPEVSTGIFAADDLDGTRGRLTGDDWAL